jgi:glycosyltransferase involved in cell wall biosynthesis/predicted RNA methylase
MTFAFLIDSVPFTRAVINGDTSLGGSESACLGLARALQKRGHDVHIFTTQLDADCVNTPDRVGVTWHLFQEFLPMNTFIEWDVVVALRMIAAYANVPVAARLRLLWTQDLLVPGPMQQGMMSIAWAVDHIAYVSQYHRKQWEQLQPELAPLGWVTRNGFDIADLPAEPPTKDSRRVIHISRPERGLGPLLKMWPLLKIQDPDAQLQICRYSSMYDTGPGSWSDECARWDREVAQVNHDVGGITYLGELNKKQLYQAISEAAVMWYPGVATFAETNCIAALEAEACQTPFVGSYRGALPETSPTGILIRGDADHDLAYQQASVHAVFAMLQGCVKSSFDYRRRQKAGRLHAQGSTYAVLAAEWEAQIETWFRERYQSNRVGVLRQLLHEDDHVAAKIVATEIGDTTTADFCDYVIAGKDQTAEHYGASAIHDPLYEAEESDRFKAVRAHFTNCTRVLDVACGNGAFALSLAMADPKVIVHGLDYSAENIARAQEAAIRANVADRCTFETLTIYDFDRQTMHADWQTWLTDRVRSRAPRFDGAFIGEFIEHVANHRAVIDGVEGPLETGAQVIYTCPHGACVELMPRDVPLRRGHVHRFHHDDIKAVWGPKAKFTADYVHGGMSERGNALGNWLIRYVYEPHRPAGARPLETRIPRTRPMPKLSVGLIVKDAENDLGRCLTSIWKIADEIVVGDTGSRDTTKAIAASFGDKVRVFDVDPVLAQPEGFAGARNAVLAQCTGDWFLWIDADEQLLGGEWLRRYLDSVVFQGFVIHQTHLYIDGPPTFDIPVRLFRNTGQVKFYGCIHEQPQDGDPNADIYPTLEVLDLRLAHTGYLTEGQRETKRTERNLPLLKRDQDVFKDRLLGKVLLIREAVIQADVHRHQHGLTVRAQQGYAHAIRLFIEHFDDPAHKFHKLARPWYEAALQHLGVGWEHEIAMVGHRGPLEGRQAKPSRFWVRDADEYRRIMTWKATELAKGMVPVSFITDPDVLIPPETKHQLEVAV